jgi:thiamine-phosphate diphosphorylase
MNEGKPRIHGLYVITRENPAKGRTHLDVARAALEAGASVIQLRDKTASSRRLLETAEAIRLLARQAGALFIINDRLDIALTSQADGVHLGDEDLPIEKARRLAGKKLIIGASAGTPQEAIQAEQAGADYLGVGCIFPTSSKEDAGPPVGVERIRQIKSVTTLPIIAIGGINAENARFAIEAGADGVAVISYISEAEDMAKAARNLIRLIKS